MTNYQARIIALSVFCGSIIVSGNFLAGCIAYGTASVLEVIVDDRE